MEWMAVIGDSIQYIEEHITDDITTDNIAKAVNVSPTAVGCSLFPFPLLPLHPHINPHLLSHL